MSHEESGAESDSRPRYAALQLPAEAVHLRDVTAFGLRVLGIHVRLPVLRFERATVPRRLQPASDSAQQRYDLHDHSVGHRVWHYKSRVRA